MNSKIPRRFDSKYIIGIDTGGTFTDVTLMTPKGELFMDKPPPHPVSSQRDLGSIDGSEQGDGKSIKSKVFWLRRPFLRRIKVG
jgi:hypothetical protein